MRKCKCQQPPLLGRFTYMPKIFMVTCKCKRCRSSHDRSAPLCFCLAFLALYCHPAPTKNDFLYICVPFSNLSWGPPTTAYFVCLPHLTHLFQLISSDARLEMGVAYERDILNVWWLPGGPQDRFENTFFLGL